MKALVKEKPEAGLTFKDIPEPKTGPTQVKVKVDYSAICGTDVSIYKWSPWAQKNVPMGTTTGHEFVGHIVEVGSQVKSLKVGQRVSAEGHVTCGHCKRCLTGLRHECPNTRGIGYHINGIFAEFAVLPAENIFVLPEHIPSKLAAIFDPFGNAVHSCMAFALSTKNVLITGAGPIGVMCAAIAKHCGAARVTITDVNDYRLKMAKDFGADVTVNIKTSALPTLADGYDIALEMSGTADGLNTALKALGMGGELVLLGILPPNTAIDWDLVIFKLLNIKGIWGRQIFKTWYQMLSLIESGLDISKLITHEFAAQDYKKAFETILSGESGRILLKWS